MDKVLAGVNQSKLKSLVYSLAFNRKKALLESNQVSRTTIWDSLVFNKIQTMLGLDRVRIGVTGSATTAPEVYQWLHCVFGFRISEGYGQTECTAGAFLSIPQDLQGGSVGCPMPCNYVKLVDVPEMEYYVRDSVGEVCIKGANVMPGYYNDPDRTAEALDKDGWLHTGDVGKWLPEGRLKIIDRKKHIFKLSQGEYVCPELVEACYTRCSLIMQAFIDGESIQRYPVGVMVPDPDVFPNWARQQFNIPEAVSVEDICKREDVRKSVLEEVRKTGTAGNLKGFEQVARIHLEPEPFSIEQGLLTPTMKSKRLQLRKKYGDVLKTLYAELAQSQDGDS